MYLKLLFLVTSSVVLSRLVHSATALRDSYDDSATSGSASVEYLDRDAGIQYTGRRIMDCLIDGDFNCVKMKVVNNLDKILRMKSYRLMDGVVVESDPSKTALTSKEKLEEEELEAAEARQLKSDDDGSLLLTLAEKLFRLFNNKVLKLNLFPGITARLSRSNKNNGLIDVSIGRGEGGGGLGGGKKGGGGYMIVYMFSYFMLAIGVAIAKMLSLKSLMVGKLALILASLGYMRKIFTPKKKHVIHHHDSHEHGDDFQDRIYSAYNQYQYQSQSPQLQYSN